MAEYQVTRWRDIPSLVTARAGDVVAKVQLAARFQEAIDEAAMRLGATDSDAYLEGWNRSALTTADGDPADVAEQVARDLDAAFDPATLARMLDDLNGAQS